MATTAIDVKATQEKKKLTISEARTWITNFWILEDYISSGKELAERHGQMIIDIIDMPGQEFDYQLNSKLEEHTLHIAQFVRDYIKNLRTSKEFNPAKLMEGLNTLRKQARDKIAKFPEPTHDLNGFNQKENEEPFEKKERSDAENKGLAKLAVQKIAKIKKYFTDFDIYWNSTEKKLKSEGLKCHAYFKEISGRYWYRGTCIYNNATKGPISKILLRADHYQYSQWRQDIPSQIRVCLEIFLNEEHEGLGQFIELFAERESATETAISKPNSNEIIPTEWFYRLELHLYRLERLKPLFIRLINECQVPREIIEAIQDPIFFRKLTQNEIDFYTRVEGLKGKAATATISATATAAENAANIATATTTAAKVIPTTDVKAIDEKTKQDDLFQIAIALDKSASSKIPTIRGIDGLRMSRSGCYEDWVNEGAYCISDAVYTLAETYYQIGNFDKVVEVVKAIKIREGFYPLANLLRLGCFLSENKILLARTNPVAQHSMDQNKLLQSLRKFRIPESLSFDSMMFWNLQQVVNEAKTLWKACNKGQSLEIRQKREQLIIGLFMRTRFGDAYELLEKVVKVQCGHWLEVGSAITTNAASNAANSLELNNLQIFEWLYNDTYFTRKEVDETELKVSKETAASDVKTVADTTLKASNANQTAAASMPAQSYLPAYSANVTTITNTVTDANSTIASVIHQKDYTEITITREVYADKTLKLVLRSPKAVEPASASLSTTNTTATTLHALEVEFANDVRDMEIHANKRGDVDSVSPSCEMATNFTHFAHIRTDLKGQHFAFINLKLHRKERLMPLFEYLIDKHAVSRAVIEGQVTQNAQFFRQETSSEKLFFERLKSARMLPKNGGHSPTTFTAATAVGIKSAGSNSSANAAVPAKSSIDSKTTTEVESIEKLIGQAKTIDTAYLKSLLDTGFQPLMGHSSFITTLESIKDRISGDALEEFEASYFKTISEAMYSLAETYFKQKAYPETLRVLAEIPKQDALNFHADLLKIKIQLINFKFDPLDSKSLSEQRNIIIRLIKNDHPEAEQLLDSQMILRYGKSKAELERIALTLDTSELPDSEGPEAMLQFFDQHFLQNIGSTSSANVAQSNSSSNKPPQSPSRAK